jgi:hypothetical protein
VGIAVTFALALAFVLALALLLLKASVGRRGVHLRSRLMLSKVNPSQFTLDEEVHEAEVVSALK